MSRHAKPRQRHTRCVDCGTETLPTGWDSRAEWYIVHDDTWTAAGMTADGGCLCLTCLEIRLDRPLTASDFPPELGVNDPDLTLDNPRYAWTFRTPKLHALLSGH